MKNSKFFKSLVSIFYFLFSIFYFAAPALAQVTSEVQGLVIGAGDPRVIAAKIIRVALSFLGVVALSLIVYAGFLWMTAAGNEERIATAKKVLINAGIGLAIILSSLAITQFIISRLLASMAMPPLPPPAAAPGRARGGALGSGIIESHYPMRSAVNVARNTRIVITLKEPIDPATISEAIPGTPEDAPILRLKTKNGKPSAVQIIKTADIEGSVRESDGDKYLGSEQSGVDVLVGLTEDKRTFVFTPVERANRDKRVFFGSAAEPISYTIYLCGTASGGAGNCDEGGIRLNSGQPAFQGRFKDYQWSFETGTFLDIAPPVVKTVVPAPASQNRPLNSMIQVNFNEAILPTVASGKTIIATNGPVLPYGANIQSGTYDIMRVFSNVGFVAGEWQIGNQYRTSEFISTSGCGRNSCGEEVFCLPEQQDIEVKILAASLAQAGNPASAGRFDGIEDMAGNSLDGNRNGTAQGPVAFFDLNQPTNVVGDNVKFSFKTGNQILLGSPAVLSTSPDITLGGATSGVSLTRPIQMTFDRFMAMSTLSSRNINLAGNDATTGEVWEAWWTVEAENLQDDPGGQQYENGRTLGRILHGGLWEQCNYVNEISSKVRDLYQNCFYPSGGGSCSPESLQYPNVYCCNNVACALGDVNCAKCGF